MISSHQHSSSQTRSGVSGVSVAARAPAREHSKVNPHHGRGNWFMENMTVSMSTVPEIDTVHLSTPTVTHFNGQCCIEIAPGDRFMCVLCGLDFKSGPQCNLHCPKCPGFPNPNQFKADGVRLFTIMEITDHLAGKDQQRDSGQTFSQCQNIAGFEVKQLNNKAMVDVAPKEAEIAHMHINNWHPGNHAAMTYSVPNPHADCLARLAHWNACAPPLPPAISLRNHESMFQAVTGAPSVPLPAPNSGGNNVI